MSEIKHSGGCHCGAVRFQFWGPANVDVCFCNCSICTKKQIKSIFVKDCKFELQQGKENLSLYTFNTHQAKHYFCKTCGVQSFYKSRSNPEGISVMYYCVDPGTLEEVKEYTFDGQNWEESMKKRPPTCN